MRSSSIWHKYATLLHLHIPIVAVLIWQLSRQCLLSMRRVWLSICSRLAPRCRLG